MSYVVVVGAAKKGSNCLYSTNWDRKKFVFDVLAKAAKHHFGASAKGVPLQIVCLPAPVCSVCDLTALGNTQLATQCAWAI